MRTIENWLQDLQEPHKSKALANMWWEDADKQERSLSEALRQAFNWTMSPEGGKYWYAVYQDLVKKAK